MCFKKIFFIATENWVKFLNFRGITSNCCNTATDDKGAEKFVPRKQFFKLLKTRNVALPIFDQIRPIKRFWSSSGIYQKLPNFFVFFRYIF
jgi:hypothetical protein